MSLRTFIFGATGALVGIAACGCASQGPKPTDELTKAHTVVEQADKGNAQRYAAADLQRAHDELSNAERAVAEKKYDDARNFAQRAEVDADLASARGNSGEAQKAAQEVSQGTSTLKQEAQRGDNGAPR
jgi:chromosome segregation ATPase